MLAIKEVTLQEMLLAREARVATQYALIERFEGKCLICFTMNIAGPIKLSPLIYRGFVAGQRLTKQLLAYNKLDIVYSKVVVEHTGATAYYIVDCDIRRLKTYMVQLEDDLPIGRLFDIDVLKKGEDGEVVKVSRKDINMPARACLICGKIGAYCARSRAHSLKELREYTIKVLSGYIQKEDISFLAAMAIRALLYEVAVTPKPGLVDRANNGSHKDMDFYTFIDSATSLIDYFRQCATLGYDLSIDIKELLPLLRKEGIKAQKLMLEATKGVNTHKGAIFSLGIVVASSARAKGLRLKPCYNDGDSLIDSILSLCSRIAYNVMEDFKTLSKDSASTYGEKLYLDHNITGVRGEIALGLPTVRDIGLKVFSNTIRKGANLNQAGYMALLHMLASMDDTNIIGRLGRQEQLRIKERLKDCLTLNALPSVEEVQLLDKEYIKLNVSPGGSADLLAIVYYLYFIDKEEAYEYNR